MLQIWSMSKNQGNSWLEANYDLPKMSKFQIMFEGVRGDNYQGDIALDDISFTGCTLSTLCAEDAFTCGGLQCIHKDELCDFIPQCKDGSDEANCGRLSVIIPVK